MRTSWPAAAVLAAGVLLSGCAGGTEGADPQATSPPTGRPIVKPARDIVPKGGGGDVPDATVAVCRQCQEMLRQGRYAALAEKMDAAAAQASARDAVRASKKAVARVCAGVAKANLGRYEEALRDFDKADELREDLPAEIRPQMLELLYHGELVSAAAVGDRTRVEAAVTGLQDLGLDPAGYLKDACTAAPSVPACEKATPPSGTAPSSSGGTGPTTSGTPPATTDTPSGDVPRPGTEEPTDGGSEGPGGDEAPATPEES